MAEKLFTNILVATDGSDRNITAVEEAIRIATGCGAALNAVYVIDAGTFESASADVVMEDTYRIIKAEAEQALKQVRSLSGNIEVKTTVIEGKPAQEIVRFATAEKIDLIVIGTQGKKGIERILLGSVAESIIRLAGCKVLVVK